MSERPAVRFRDAGKMYRIYPSRRDGVIDAIGLARLLRRRGATFREFWALRAVDLEIEPGTRLGVIGRNGAGKSTLLKMLTGNVSPTEGVVEVNGRVQALLEAGGGLHPEFTGHENIHAALTYQGLSRREIADQTADIEEFTELGEFLDQPLKTYSLGMQARLAFAIATTVNPEILIIDEVLGAGDAYFFTKSIQRMRGLVNSGATVLIVSHALEQIARFCDDAVWLDRGRIVARGPALDVIKRYEAYIRRLEDRRLRAKNHKAQAGRYSGMQQELYADHLVLRAVVEDGFCDVHRVTLLRDGQAEDAVMVGDAQDADSTQSAFVVVETDWSAPQDDEAGSFRRLAGTPPTTGEVLFHLWTLYEQSTYAIEVTYRTSEESAVAIEANHAGAVISTVTLEGSTLWRTHHISLAFQYASQARPSVPVTRMADTAKTEIALGGKRNANGSADARSATTTQSGEVSRWIGIGSLLIEQVLLLGSDDEERAIFQAFHPMKVEVTFRAEEGGVFPIAPAAILHRLDGVRVTTVVGDSIELTLDAGEKRRAVLDFGPLNLGNGRYIVTAGLYEDTDPLGPQPYYDVMDRSYEFEVFDASPYAGIFQHPGAWQL